MSDEYRISLEQLEARSRVSEREQVVLVGDGMGPPAVAPLCSPDGDAEDGDGD